MKVSKMAVRGSKINRNKGTGVGPRQKDGEPLFRGPPCLYWVEAAKDRYLSQGSRATFVLTTKRRR